MRRLVQLPRLIIVISLVAIAGCSSTSKVDTSTTVYEKDDSLQKKEASLPPDQARLYQLIKGHFEKKRFSNALTEIAKFKKTYPESTVSAQVYNYEGLILFSQREYALSVDSFIAAAEVSGDAGYASYIYFNLASAYRELNQTEKALDTCAKVDFKTLDPNTRVKFFLLESSLFAKVKNSTGAVRELVRAAQVLDFYGRSNPQSGRYWLKVEAQLKELLQIQFEWSISELEDLYAQARGLKIAHYLLFKLGEENFRQKSFSKAKSQLNELINQFPNSPFYLRATDYLRSIESQGMVEPNAIGILLPLTGEFAQYGYQTLHGIELALNLFSAPSGQSSVRLILENSGKSTEQAVEALDRLFFEHHVVAVIGPLLSKNVDAVTNRAQDLGVPLLSLAQKKGNAGNYVFYSTVTPLDQAKEVARYAVENLKLKKIAILYPRDKYGEASANAFWDVIEAGGSEIVGAESYEPNETDFKAEVDKLAGLYYQSARQWEIDKLASLRRQDGITRRNLKTESYFRIPPIVDFEAIFIPDEAKTVSQAIPTFAYRDVEGIRFLGTATWNSPLLVEKAYRPAQNSVFVDSFFSDSADPRSQDFVKRFSTTFGYDPTALEAASFDATNILNRALGVSGESPARSDIRDLLASLREYPGVTGMISYDQGSFRRKLRVLTFQGKSVVELPK